MDLRQLFATNLRRIRHDRKISQEQLAHDAGVDRAYLSREERAVTYVGLEIIEKVAAVLEVDPAEFFRPALPARISKEGRLGPLRPLAVSRVRSGLISPAEISVYGRPFQSIVAG